MGDLVILGITLAATNTSIGLMNLVDAKSERMRLAYDKLVHGSSIIYGSIGPNTPRKISLKYWIACVKLAIKYETTYPNGGDDEHFIELPDEVLYIIRYTPALVNHFFVQKTGINGVQYYTTYRTSITLPTDEFSIESTSCENEVVNLSVKVYISDGTPSTIRCATSQYFYGWFSSVKDARSLQKKTMIELLNNPGMDNLISDIEYSSPNNTRFNVYLTQMSAYNAIDGIGNPAPANDPPKKVGLIYKELTGKDL